MMNLAR
jgi:predicted RNase H-like HicB family nuclease